MNSLSKLETLKAELRKQEEWLEANTVIEKRYQEHAKGRPPGPLDEELYSHCYARYSLKSQKTYGQISELPINSKT